MPLVCKVFFSVYAIYFSIIYGPSTHAVQFVVSTVQIY